MPIRRTWRNNTNSGKCIQRCIQWTKAVILIPCLGSSEKIICIFELFHLLLEAIKLNELLNNFKNYFAPKKKNPIIRNSFLKRFCNWPNKASFQCKFGTMREETVWDISSLCYIWDTYIITEKLVIGEDNTML